MRPTNSVALYCANTLWFNQTITILKKDVSISANIMGTKEHEAIGLTLGFPHM